MEAASRSAPRQERFSCREVPPSRPVPSLAEDAREGLASVPRSLPPKYFYDDCGSRLFDRICDTPEYYPTRTEDALLAEHARAVIAATLPEHIIELGSGTSRKTRHLLDACEAEGVVSTYWPFDVCEGMLRESGDRLLEDYPWLTVEALVGDYLAGLDHFPDPRGRRLFVFLGGTIGNFEPARAQAFLAELRHRLRPGDALLLGTDRVKDPAVLHAAYNDAAGITAQFNLNVLAVLNRELEADFVLDAFEHRAEYNTVEQQIEMYLVAGEDQQVRLGTLGLDLELSRGERILTEISRKFTPKGLSSLLGEAGFVIERHFTPESEYFSLTLAVPG